jgi:hypothetical protein
MSFLPASRTKRNLFKIASLGLAGLLAGLLAGCTDFPEISATTSSYTQVASDSFNPDASAEAQPAQLPKSLDETQIPALRHPPTSRTSRPDRFKSSLSQCLQPAVTVTSTGNLGSWQ